MQKRRVKMWLAVAAIGGAAAVGAVLRTVTINSSSITLRTMPTNIAPAAGFFSHGTTLDVLEDRGMYARVKTGNTEGWLRVADLEPRVFKAPQAQGALLSGDTAAGPVQEARSGKGLNDGINDIADGYAQANGVSTAALEALQDQRKQLVDRGEYEKFAKEGNVGKR